MDRRELAKKAAVVSCGLAMPLCGDGKAAEAPTKTDHIGRNASGSFLEIDFPDKIVSMVEHQDRLIVACERSIWELYVGHDGLFNRKLITAM